MSPTETTQAPPSDPKTSSEPQLLELGPDLTVYIGAERDARFIYKEIYQDHCYDVAPLPDDAFIIDAGANIGLFTLYMKTKYPCARILAFEPVPQIFDLYQRNLALHGVPPADVTAHQCALGSEPSGADPKQLTYFPNAPGNSTFVPQEKELLRKALPAEHYQRMIDRSSAGATQVPVRVERLSRFLDEWCGGGRVPRVDFLKIDVESWELEVLRGVDDRHWELVRNVAVEVSDLSGLRGDIEALLKDKGFAVERELASWSYETAPTYTVLARRKD